MSPHTPFPPAPRRRDSLLASLEKKAIPTGMIIFAPSGADPQLSCDLISALTDTDMEIIENYASRLEEALGGDAEDAYAIAMDAFVRGKIIFIYVVNKTIVQYSTVQYSTVQYSTFILLNIIDVLLCIFTCSMPIIFFHSATLLLLAHSVRIIRSNLLGILLKSVLFG